MSVSVFDSEGYVPVLRTIISENRGQKGYREKLAKAAGCHRTQISLVLTGRIHLTLEQACGISEFLEWGPLEQQYFLSLVELERAGTPALRRAVQARLKKLRGEWENLSVRFEAAPMDEPLLAKEYYLNWEVAAVHLLVGTDRQITAAEMASRLGVLVPIVDGALERLTQMGLLSRGGDLWVLTTRNLHAPRGSVGDVLHQTNWRLQSIQRLPRVTPGNLHYTALHTLSKKDVDVFRKKLLQFIESARALVAPSLPEELVCFTCDFIPL